VPENYRFCKDFEYFLSVVEQFLSIAKFQKLLIWERLCIGLDRLLLVNNRLWF